MNRLVQSVIVRATIAAAHAQTYLAKV